MDNPDKCFTKTLSQEMEHCRRLVSSCGKAYPQLHISGKIAMSAPFSFAWRQALIHFSSFPFKHPVGSNYQKGNCKLHIVLHWLQECKQCSLNSALPLFQQPEGCPYIAAFQYRKVLQRLQKCSMGVGADRDNPRRKATPAPWPACADTAVSRSDCAGCSMLWLYY